MPSRLSFVKHYHLDSLVNEPTRAPVVTRLRGET